MKIAVTTPTGHIGRVVTDRLLSAQVSVVLLARDPAKVRAFKDRGAIVATGSLDDGPFVVDATRGVDALFWLTPPRNDAPHFRNHQRALGRIAAAAVRKNGIARVVNLSSVGAQHATGVGPVSGLHDVEKMLDEVAANVTHLRPGFFFENFLWQVEPMKTSGSIFLPIPAPTSLSMIATRDIGEAAASRLLDAGWTGRSVQHLLGPADLTLEQAAIAISEGAGRKVSYVQVPMQAAQQSMLSAGMSQDTANQMLELYDGTAAGRLTSETPRDRESTTATTLVHFSHEVIRPLLGSVGGNDW